MKKRIVMIVVAVALIIGIAMGTTLLWKKDRVATSTIVKDDEANDGKADLDDNTPYILNGTWWIGETNTGIKEDGRDVIKAYINEDRHLIIVSDDGIEKDMGYISTTESVVPLEKFIVTFKDYDGTVLKTEQVEFGKRAIAPDPPFRNGYTFTGWNQAFEKVISNMEVVAQYQRITAPTLIVSDVTTTAGATNVEVAVQAQNNPGIAGLTLNIEYDEKALTISKVISNKVLAGLSFQKPKTYKNGCKLMWYGTEPDAIVDGIAFKLVFTIKKYAPSGTYPITLTYATGYDVSLRSIDMEIINGSIVIDQN